MTLINLPTFSIPSITSRRAIPLTCLPHDFNLLESLMRPHQFLANNGIPFLVIKAHSKTCLSCSTFL